VNDDLQDDLAKALLGNEEEKKDDVEAATEEVEEEKADDDKSTDGQAEDNKEDDKEAVGDGAASDDVAKGDDAEATDTSGPLSKEDIRAILREEAQTREETTAERQSFAGQVRNELKEALKLDSDYTTVKLEDGTVIESVSQLTNIINPETNENYTREEAAQMLLQAQQTISENIQAVERRVDQLTDLNVSFKEEADRVQELYGDLLKEMPEVAEDLIKAYQKTFTVDKDNGFVTNITISPLEFYGAALKPYQTQANQLAEQRRAEEAAEAKAKAEAEAKAEMEDRGDIGTTAPGKETKKDALDTAMDKYLEEL